MDIEKKSARWLLRAATFLCVWMLFAPAFAAIGQTSPRPPAPDPQPQTIHADSLDYELQRQKVNHLLDQRAARFGHFDESLKKRTGIFGLKTKKDMQASLDILHEIVLTDNEIFRETRHLLSYKDQMLNFKEFEKERIARLAADYDQRINGYISTISKLQREQENIRDEVERLRMRNGLINGVVLLMLAVLATLGLFFWRKKRPYSRKTKN